MTTFIGVSFGVIDNKLAAIATSSGYSVVDMSGLSTRAALGFLWSIQKLPEARKVNGKRPALVMFDTCIDLELLLKDLSPAKKDILFGIYRQKENANKDLPIFDNSTPEYRGQANAYGFIVSQFAGKILRLVRPKRTGMSFYDVSGYFCCGDISEAAEMFLHETHAKQLEKNMLPLWTEWLGEQIAERCQAEAALIVRLAERVAEVIEPLDIAPRQWYGPSAIAARCLHKWKARRQAKILNDKNSAAELLKAIDCAYFGGRVEAIKLGTVQDVRTFDLNSAYAYATTLLSQFARPLRFTRRYEGLEQAPFSCWLVEYDLPDTVNLGVLPTRAPRGGISFRRRGRGYFWQPEIDYLVRRYPDSFRVSWGYVGPEYKPVTFADAVSRMYDYRLDLIAKSDAGEKIIKLALANLYGKFAQNSGTAHFQCRAWAGWITSLVRRMLLDAVTGIEDKVICFCQDAIHLQGCEAIGIEISDSLGAWKRKQYAQGLYISPGIYDLSEDTGASAKQATRGVNRVLGLDFDRIARDLSERQATELTRSFFVGWQLSRQASLRFKDHYLTEVSESLDLIPTRLRARNYLAEFDWQSEYRDSVINSAYTGQLSARYVPNDSATHPAAALRLRLKDRGFV